MIENDHKVYKHNFIVNILDGAFFGFGIGYASYVTLIPLFVSTLTDSAIVIGLITAIHSVGWQLPQLFNASSVARQARLKPMVLLMSVQERLPYFGLAIAAWFLPVVGKQVTLVITFVLLIWQGLGAGFTANPWQSLIAKIIPSDARGFFFGSQASAANLLASASAILAGITLDRVESPLDYALCFLFATIGMIISWLFLNMTKEIPSQIKITDEVGSTFWPGVRKILKNDSNFRWFLVARASFSFATMAFAFYTVYAVRHLMVSEAEIGLMTAIYTGTQIAANPLLGWLSDRWSPRNILAIGALAASASALIASKASISAWFYLVFILAGFGVVALWTVGLALTLTFGEESERPYYIGLSNTLVAPIALIAPFLGGWLADMRGYPTTFIASVIGGLFTIFIVMAFLKDPGTR